MELSAVAQAHGVDPKTVRRWVKRYESEGFPGLCARSSRPRRQPQRTSDAVEATAIEWRHRRWTMTHIAERVGVSRAPVSRILRRHGLNRMSMLERPEPLRR
ncbi:helix-turn-helix domain-containing protein [Natronocella acetinitrilica]|uniref:helix-turn-helix domain-containing protein n=1 Tax=Natronocella acetinitrilica TaxID=414046 RepID=UPI003F502FE6